MPIDPLNFMFAIITDETQARRAFEALRRVGLGEDDVFVLAGADGASWIDAIGTRPAIIDPEEQRKQQQAVARASSTTDAETPATESGAETPDPTPASSPAPARSSPSTAPGEPPHLFTRLMRALGINPGPSTPRAPRETINWTDPDRYKHAASEGHFVFAVRAPSPEDQDRVSRVLKEYGGRFINYYGRLNTTTYFK